MLVPSFSTVKLKKSSNELKLQTNPNYCLQINALLIFKP